VAHFFVGQRVRLVRAVHQENNGITGVITHIGPWRFGDKLPDGTFLGAHSADCFLRLDYPRHDGDTVGPNKFEHLEPILPEGAAPSEFTFSELMENLGVVEA